MHEFQAWLEVATTQAITPVTKSAQQAPARAGKIASQGPLIPDVFSKPDKGSAHVSNSIERAARRTNRRSADQNESLNDLVTASSPRRRSLSPVPQFIS